MKNNRCNSRSSHHKKVICTVSAAALMLGVSSAATVGLHFQENYCTGSGAPASGYSGFPVTVTAFGIPPASWENLTPMDSGYQGCAGPLGYTLNEVINTTTSTDGLNPLPNGSLNVTWFGPTANFDQFAGYGGIPPYYADVSPGGSEALPTNATGEMQIYCTFIRDGINFGPDSNSGDNDQPGYSIDVTGLKSVFTNSPYVVEMIASGDSIQSLTNVLVVDVTNSITNSVTYPNIPLPDNTEGTSFYQGTGGGLSTGSAPFTSATADHIKIMSAQPVHVAGGYNHAGTVCGFIITDKPVISMSPQSLLAGPGDTINLSAYAIGVPPLTYQWRLNGTPIPQATNLSYTISNVNLNSGGNFDLLVSNLYGVATSKVASVTVDRLVQTAEFSSNLVVDSNPDNAQHNGVDLGATWLASSSDGTVTRTGVMSFNAIDTNGITVPDAPGFDGPVGTITFWMQSAGTDESASGYEGASLISRYTSGVANDFVLLQLDGAPGNLYFQTPNGKNNFTSAAGVSDDDWHFVALTFNQSASGGVALYIDGALDTTNANNGSWSWTTGQPLDIGFSADPDWRAYNGILDEIRYYSAILTTSEISSIYSSGALADSAALQMEFSFTTAPGANAIVIQWSESSAVLQSAPSVDGPWTDVPGASTPYTIVPTASQQFFRYLYVPQSLASNPYLM